jgi:putative ABC transport system ATP-binding protein
MIAIKDISVSFGNNGSLALDRVSLDIAAGESLAIMGQSGSGKSTLLAVMGGMLRANSGNYLFRGQSVSQMPPKALAQFRGREIGFVFQNFCLLPHLTLLENLLVPMEHLKPDWCEVKARAHALLEQVGISALAERLPAQVSGGQAQRAAIARALMRNPGLILADEPTGSLDEESAENILGVLKSLTAAGTTVVVVTHSAQVSDSLSRTVRIEKGRVVVPECVS